MNTRRKRFRIGFLFLPILFMLNGCLAGFEMEEFVPNTMDVPKAYSELSIRGINVGNALDAPEPGQWGVMIDPEYFHVIKQAGFNAVRLPVRFSAHTGGNPSYIIDKDFFAMVNDLINHGLNAGLIVILDLHHFDEVMNEPINYEEKLIAMWDQISRVYSAYPDNLYYEILNEPSRELTRDRWNDLAARVISVIRKNDTHRKIIVDSVDFSNINTIQTLTLPEKRNLIVTFHYYEPFEFTHQGADWVRGSNQWLGNIWIGTAEEKKQIENELNQAAEWSNRNQIPVLMGEFGTIEKADRASRIRWTEFLAREAEKRQISWIYWQFCSNFSLYSCDTRKWDETLLGALIPKNTSK